MMLRDTSGPYEYMHLTKSRSCPADFTSDEIDNPLLGDQSEPRTPPVSNGRRKSSTTTKRPSSDSKKPRAPSSMNGSLTMMMSPTTTSSGLYTLNSGSSRSNSSSKVGAAAAVPGRPRRRGNRTTLITPKRKKNPSQSLRYRLLNSRWMQMKPSPSNAFTSLIVAVILWYSFGVISITTSNLLMMEPSPDDYVGGVPPLLLTLQQLIIGSTLLQFLLKIRFIGSPGVQPWPSPSAAAAREKENRRKNLLFNNLNTNQNSQLSDLISSNLVLSGITFAMGFLATNSGFLAGGAAFVETVKAAEPITSAMVAVLWRIESLSGPEVLSLGSIVTGVLISTLAHSASKSADAESVGASLLQSLQSCFIVMTANLCFSFRGLYQKLFRASPEGNSAVIDDLNLQLRMQQIGVMLLAIPVIVFDMPGLSAHLWTLTLEVGLIRSGFLFRYMGLALINGIAFTSYNLASTYILTRISVVHHAALNCIRRIFAIIVTSLYFGIPITVMGIMGFFVSFGGFMSFTHYKIQRQKQPKQISSLLPVSAVAVGTTKSGE